MRRGLVDVFPVTDPDEKRSEQDPSELIPVEKRKTEKSGRGAGIQRGEAEAEIGQDEEPAVGSAFFQGLTELRFGFWRHRGDAITVSGCGWACAFR